MLAGHPKKNQPQVTAALQLDHSRAYSTAWECVRMIRCDSSSELPGIHLGTSGTVRSAMLMYKEGKKLRLGHWAGAIILREVYVAVVQPGPRIYEKLLSPFFPFFY